MDTNSLHQRAVADEAGHVVIAHIQNMEIISITVEENGLPLHEQGGIYGGRTEVRLMGTTGDSQLRYRVAGVAGMQVMGYGLPSDPTSQQDFNEAVEYVRNRFSSDVSATSAYENARQIVDERLGEAIEILSVPANKAALVRCFNYLEMHPTLSGDNIPHIVASFFDSDAAAEADMS